MIYREAGNQKKGRADARVVWDGLNSEGRLALDGPYIYYLYAEDKAGNATSSSIIAFSLDTEDTSAILSAEFTEFSPNADSVKDKISLRPQLRIESGIEKYELIIRDTEENEIRTYRGNGAPPESIVWDGVDSSGRKTADKCQDNTDPRMALLDDLVFIFALVLFTQESGPGDKNDTDQHDNRTSHNSQNHVGLKVVKLKERDQRPHG